MRWDGSHVPSSPLVGVLVHPLSSEAKESSPFFLLLYRRNEETPQKTRSTFDAKSVFSRQNVNSNILGIAVNSVDMVFVLSLTTRSWGGVVQRYSFLSAIASSFALAPENKPATAEQVARGPPMHSARSFHLDNCRDGNAGQETLRISAGKGRAV